MDPLLVLSEDRPSVDPGGETRVRLTVRNPGDLVEQYRLEVLGDGARGWVEVVPREVSVMPESARDETVEVVFRPPPAPGAPAGEVPFGVRCVSRERPRDCAVVEGDVLVTTVLDLQVQLLPFGPDGRRRGHFRLEVRNTGTTPLTVAVAATDGAELLRFAVAPARLSVAPGVTSSVFIAVRPRSSKFLGRPVEHAGRVTFEVVGIDRRGEEQLTYRQHPLVPRWAVMLLALLLVAMLVVLALRWPFGGDPDLKLPASAPPRLTGTSVKAGEPGTATVSWPLSAYAQSYVVQLMQGPAGGEPRTVPAPQVRYTWKELPAGNQCFSVFPKNDNGRGPGSAPVCAVVPAAPVPSSPPPSSTAPTPTPTPTTSPPPSTPGAQPFEPKGWYVVYYRAALDDTIMEPTVREVAAALQRDGAQPRVVSSLQSKALKDGTKGFWYVLADGFADQAAAQADCAAHADVPDVSCKAKAPE